jgi:hypothetical protein
MGMEIKHEFLQTRFGFTNETSEELGHTRFHPTDGSATNDGKPDRIL